MVELVVAVVEPIVHVFLAALQLLALAIELIGGLIAIVYERLERGAARVRSPSSKARPPESDRGRRPAKRPDAAL